MFRWALSGLHDLHSYKEWRDRVVSRRSQLDVLDLAIISFQEAMDELAEIAEKMERFTDLFEQLLERDAKQESDL